MNGNNGTLPGNLQKKIFGKSTMKDNLRYKYGIRTIQQRLEKQNLSLQAYIRENQNIMRQLKASNFGIDYDYITPATIKLKIASIADGKKLSSDKTKHLKEHDYDVILNCVKQILLVRKDPDRHTKLSKCHCRNIGRDRLKLLRLWLENPHLPICEETIPLIIANVGSMTPNALARAIVDLRQLLLRGPYIRTETVWGESISRTGSVYMLDPKYRYLVIKYQI